MIPAPGLLLPRQMSDHQEYEGGVTLVATQQLPGFTGSVPGVVGPCASVL